MLHLAFAHTNLSDSYQAGLALGHALTTQCTGRINAIVLFASPAYSDHRLLLALKKLCPSAIIIGSTTSSAFQTSYATTDTSSAATAFQCSALALGADYLDMSFTASLGRNLSTNFERAVWTLNATLQTGPLGSYPYHTALLFAQTQNAHLTKLIDQLVFLTGGSFSFFGAGTALCTQDTATSNGQQQQHMLYYDTQMYSDAAALLIIHSRRPIGLGICHGWQKSQQAVQVTRTSGSHILELNHLPPIEALQGQLSIHRQAQNEDYPHLLATIPYNTLALQAAQKHVSLTIQDDGTIISPAEFPRGTMLSLLAPVTSPVEAIRIAMRQATRRLAGNHPAAAFLFANMPAHNWQQQDAIERAILTQARVPVLACTTDGQFIHSQNTASGYYYGTAVVGLFPDTTN